MNIELLNVTLNDTDLYCSHLPLHTLTHSWASKMQHSVPQQQAQRKRQRNKRCRDAYHDKLSSSKVPRLDENIPVAGSSSELRTPAARRQALSRAKSALPLRPRKYVETVGDLMNAATPRKLAIFEMQGQYSSVQLKIGRDVISSLQQTQRSRDKASRQTRSALLSVCAKYHSVRQSSRLYHIHRKTAAKRLFKDVSLCSADVRLMKGWSHNLNK